MPQNLTAAESLDLRLLEAASKGDQSSLESLLNSGAEINAVDSQKKTSLMLAAANGHKMVVLILLKRAPYLSIKDGNGDTALDMALKNGQRCCVHFEARNASSQRPIKRSKTQVSS